jgi:hypothetical protein
MGISGVFWEGFCGQGVKKRQETSPFPDPVN